VLERLMQDTLLRTLDERARQTMILCLYDVRNGPADQPWSITMVSTTPSVLPPEILCDAV